MLGKTKPQVSTLISDRWESGMGEVGALVGAAYLKSGGRFDQIGVEPFADRYDLADFNHNGLFPGNGSDPGDLLVAPRGGGNSVELTDRDRIAVNAMVQWRPGDDMDLFLEGVYNKYKYTQDAYSVFANRGSLLPLPGADFTVYPDTNVVRTGAYRDVQFTSNTNYFDRDARTWQIATGGSWHPTTRFQLATDLSYTKSQREDLSGSLRIGNPDNATGTTLNFDTGAVLPVLALSGFDVNNPALYSYINSSHSIEATRGSGYAGQVDGTYELNDAGLQRFIVGVRYAKRDIERSQGTQNHIPSGTRPGSLLPEGLVPITYGSFFRGTPTPGLTGLLAPPASLVRDIDLQCAAFGDTVCFPQLNPLNTYEQSETVKSVYGQLDFRFDAFGMPLDGNLGARYLWTNLGVDGFRTSTSGSSQPINQDSGYTDFLPSLNARLTLVPSVYLRLAAAKQLTRPNFSDLSPNLSLSTQTAIGLTGQAGNPDLKPLRATSYDLGLEWYFSDSGYTYLAGFLKDVDGFIQTVTSVEPVSLPDYPTYTTAQITRPQNGANGKIKGFEAGVQSFFDFLPSPFDGFGVQANYTYVNSSAPGPIAGTSVPLVGLSPHSYNLVAFYEKNAFRARVAYNWRDDYVDTTAGPGSGSLPIFAKPYGVLDASIGYHLNQHVDVSVDASNLTRARFSTYFGQEIRPRFTNIFDRTFGLVVHVTM
jgi:TonB-dependent receptor